MRIPLVLALLLGASQAPAQGVRATARSTASRLDWGGADCPFRVDQECTGRCGTPPDPAAACAFAHFTCQFRICWAGSRARVIRRALQTFLLNPESYLLPGDRLEGTTGIDSLSIRLVDSDVPGLYLSRGRFRLDLEMLSSASAARRRVTWAQTCARRAVEDPSSLALIERSESSDTLYRVTSCEGGLSVVRADGSAGTARSSGSGGSTGSSSGATTGGSGTEPPVAGPGAGEAGGSGRPRGTRTREEIRRMPDSELRRILDSIGEVSTEHNILTVRGVHLFAPSTAPEDAMRATADLTVEQMDALKEEYTRVASDVVGTAGAQDPPSAGMEYVYDPETGRAIEKPADEPTLREGI